MCWLVILSDVKMRHFHDTWIILDILSGPIHSSWVCLEVRSLEHSLKEMREQEDETLAGQRGGRIQKWIASNEEARKKAGLSAPEKLQPPGKHKCVRISLEYA